jgi:serine/threonine protein kinase
MTDLLTPGQTLSHYRILLRLGAGAMGEVYKAHDTSLDRPVALKVLLADYVEDKSRLRRFIREAKAASALNHPHIITIYEIGEAKLHKRENGNGETQATELQTDDTKPMGTATDAPIQYIAMEFVDGETLERKIHRDRTDLKKLLDYLAQVAEGLAAAHAAGIIHRDLKPENIMIRRDGYAKLLDFGVAKLTERRPVTGTLVEPGSARSLGTAAGTLVGTVGYMSPEQVHAKPVDHRSDIFSFGCILYEAVARKRAFEGEDFVDSLHKILHQEPPALESLLPGVPLALGQIVGRCLAKDPVNRYSSIAEVATRLKEIRKEMEGLLPRVSSATAEAESIQEGLRQPASVASSSVLYREQASQTLVDLEVQTQPFRWSRRYLGLAGCAAVLLAASVILIPKFTARSTGTLRMESKPSGAEVYVNEELRGSTPLLPTELAVGSYRVRLELKGYKSETDAIEITRGSIVSRSYTLTPDPPDAQPAEPMPAGGLRGIEVKHPHLFRRDCQGYLLFHGKSIEYRTSGSHAFKLPLSRLSDLTLLPDKIIIRGANIPGERIDLQQIKKTARPNLTDFYASVRKNWKAKV